MSQSVWKYPLRSPDTNVIQVPRRSRVLACQTQREVPCLWILVSKDDEKDLETREFRIYETGHEIDGETGKRHIYVGSAQTNGGSLVWHVFEVARY